MPHARAAVCATALRAGAIRLGWPPNHGIKRAGAARIPEQRPRAGCRRFVPPGAGRSRQEEMKPGFYTIMAAQFFSSLADNALLIAAIALLRELHEPAWMTPALKQSFVVSYVILAPLV